MPCGDAASGRQAPGCALNDTSPEVKLVGVAVGVEKRAPPASGAGAGQTLGGAPGGGPPAGPLATPAGLGSEQLDWQMGVIEEDGGRSRLVPFP